MTSGKSKDGKGGSQSPEKKSAAAQANAKKKLDTKGLTVVAGGRGAVINITTGKDDTKKPAKR